MKGRGNTLTVLTKVGEQMLYTEIHSVIILEVNEFLGAG
jgi:hypothetical protein